MLKVLEKITAMIRNQLKDNLGTPLLKELIKNEFLRRKFKLEAMNKRIDHRVFQTIYDSSLMDMFVSIVNADLYPKEAETDPLHAMAPPPPK